MFAGGPPSRRRRHDRWQRTVDVLLAGSALAVLTPLLAVIAVAVLVADGRPVFFSQSRVGRRGRPFTLLKFRSMRNRPGALVTTSGDPRITPFGALLRRTKLDELPQLWHVLAGEMSIVGPRPEVPLYVAAWPTVYASIDRLRPGLTDIASLALADEEQLLREHADEPAFYADCLLPRKLAMARLYRRHRSLAFDAALIAGTVLRIAGARSWSARLIGASLFDRVRFEVPPRRTPQPARIAA